MEPVIDEAKKLRRSGRFRDALRLVSPLVYPQGRFRPRAGALAEYALALAQLGAPEAAERLLLQVEVRQAKETFALALCRMLQWKHAEAACDLEAYGASVEPGSYDAWVAFANLLWCRLYEGKTEAIASAWDGARDVLELHPVLYANVWTTVAKAEFLHRLHGGAPLITERHLAAVPALSPYDELALRFSEILAEACAGTRILESSTIAILESKGRDKGLFEFARECALWRALFSSEGEGELLSAAGWGTPFAGFSTYAARVSRWLGRAAQARDDFACFREGGWERCGARPAFDPWDDPASPFTRGERRLLATLAADTHRPATHERLFLASHEEGHFNPDTATGAMHVALSRLRRKCRDAGLAWEVRADTWGFRLVVNGTGVKVPARIAFETGASHDEGALVLAHVSANGCTRAQLEGATGLHPRKLTRVLAALVEQGAVVRQGRGPASAYVRGA